MWVRGEYIPQKIRIPKQTTRKGKLWEIVELTIRIILFLCLFEIRIQDFLYREFSFHVLPEKNYHHLKCESHPKFKFDLGPSYTAILKNGSTPHQPGGGGAGVGANYVHIFWFSRYSNFCIFPSLSLSVIVYDVTNRLRKNLKTHIVWHLEK